MSGNFRREGCLPSEVQKLFEAQQEFVGALNSALDLGLNYSLDGRLVGDLGKWIANRDYGVEFTDGSNIGRKGEEVVRVNATISGQQAGFKFLDRSERPDRLLVFAIRHNGTGYDVIYDGSYHDATSDLYEQWDSQDPAERRTRSISVSKLKRLMLDLKV